MALRGTLTHRKTRRLAQLLKVDPPAALGYVEALFHVTGEQCPAGDIGRLTDADIAMEMFSSLDPAMLISAFIESGWLDVSEQYRLVVHDWSQHSDDATDLRVARSGRHYADGAMPRMNRLSASERATLCARNGWEDKHVSRRATACHEKPLPDPVPVPNPEPKTLAPNGATPIRPEEFANVWNRCRGPLPKVERFSDSRRKKVASRIREGVSIEAFEKAVSICAQTPFLLGTNDRGWKADFDWLVENDTTIERVINGKYASGGGNGASGSNRAEDRNNRSRDNIANAAKSLGIWETSGADEPDESVETGHGFTGGHSDDLASRLDEAGERVRSGTVRASPGHAASQPDILPPAARDQNRIGGHGVERAR